MEIRKDSQVGATGMPTAQQLEAINSHAKAQLTAQQVYVFSLRLCDDQVDRDMERFDTSALPALAKLFIGKTGILDHKWSSDCQVARIFQTQVVQENGVSFIKAWAYIRRCSGTDEIIADIDAGIKKEVSVGCAMGRSVCSICGSEYGQCGHQKGTYYDGQMCCAILKEPMDAYEFSFVAVPAQRGAGVIKGAGTRGKDLKALAEEFGMQEQYRALYADAALGKTYCKLLQDQVVRLCLTLQLGVEEPVLRAVTEKLGAQELQTLKEALQDRVDASLPATPQLGGAYRKTELLDGGYLI